MKIGEGQLIKDLSSHKILLTLTEKRMAKELNLLSKKWKL